MRSLLGASSHRRSRLPRQLAAAASTLALLVLASRALAEAQAQTSKVERGSPSGAISASARVILLVRTAGDDGVMTRVRAELAASAWRILEIRLDERSEREPLARVAASQDVRAAVRLDLAQSRVELWIEGRSGDVEETLATGEDRGDDPVLAYRITEALRARGLELGPAPAPAEASAEAAANPPAASTEPAPVRPPTGKAPSKAAAPIQAGPGAAPAVVDANDANGGVWLGAGPALDVGLGGLGVAAAGWLGARFAFPSRWSVGAFTTLPIVPQQLSASEGSASVSTYLFGAAADADFVSSARFCASAGLGASLALSFMRGDAAAGYVGVHDTVTSLVPFARAGARAALSRRLWLSLGVLGGFAFPEVSVRFADQQRATWGRPLVLASLGLEVALH